MDLLLILSGQIKCSECLCTLLQWYRSLQIANVAEIYGKARSMSFPIVLDATDMDQGLL